MAELLVVMTGLGAMVPAVWWLAWPLGQNGGGDDRMFVPPARVEAAEHVIGACAVLAVGAAVRLLHALVTSGRLRMIWIDVLTPLAFAAAYAGLTYRIATAPVSGANIGGALMVVAAVPITIMCLGVATWALSGALPRKRFRRAPR